MKKENQNQEKKPRKLSKKAKGFARDMAILGNGTEAALRNYDTDDYSTAASIASENLKKLEIIAEVERIEKTIAERIPDDLLVQTHLEGLKATSLRFTPEGDKIEVPDYATRHKYVNTGYELKKVIKGGDEVPKAPNSGATYNFIFSPEVRANVQAIDAKIKEALMKPKDAKAD